MNDDIPNDIDLYFKNDKLGISNSVPKKKLDVGGDIKAYNLFLLNGKLYNYNDNIALESEGNQILVNKDHINFQSQKIGINNDNPQDSLDVNGNIKLNGMIKGIKGNIISNEDDININPESSFNQVNINGDTLFKNNVLINNKNLDIENNSLVVKNKIYDGEGKEFANFSRNYFSIGNTENSKNINFNGKVNFTGINNGVNISKDFLTDKASGGELYVDDKIKTKNIEISDNTIKFNEGQSNNIRLGKYSNFSNLNNNDQSLLIGHNLYSDNDNIKIFSSSDNDGYRGIYMNSSNGIQFYANNQDVVKDFQPKLPNFTISNSGQVIFSIPVLPYEFQLEDINNDIYKYIRQELSNKLIGSSMTFTTQEYLENNMVFNAIKNRDTTAKCFIINKLNNNVEKHFDINFSDS